MEVYLSDFAKKGSNNKYYFDLVLNCLPYKGEFGSMTTTDVSINGEEIEATYSSARLKQTVRMRPGSLFIYVEFLEGERKGTTIQVEEHGGLDQSESIPIDQKEDKIRDIMVEVSDKDADCMYVYVYDNKYDSEHAALHECLFKEAKTTYPQAHYRDREDQAEDKIMFPNSNSTYAGDINTFVGKIISGNIEELFMQLKGVKKL